MISVTCRTVDEAAREEILYGRRMKVLAQQAGQRFILAQDKARDLTDDIVSDSSDHDDADDKSPPAETVKNRPLRRNPSRKSGPGSAQHRRRSPGNVSRSASPSSTRKRNPAPVAWSAEDDEKLRR